MAKSLGDWLAGFMADTRTENTIEAMPSMGDIHPSYESIEPFALGTQVTPKTRKRSRKEIYTVIEQMATDPSLAEGLALHVMAALGGHESRGDVVFMTPIKAVRGSGRRAKELRQRVELQARYLTPLLNDIAVKICMDAVTFGDGYARIHAEEKRGIVDLMCNEYTYPPLIQPFEQGSRTIGYHCLESRQWENVITKLTHDEVMRVSLPRMRHTPQTDLITGIQQARVLKPDSRAAMPIVPAPVGGSFLSPIEDAWRNVNLTLAAMNTQQIADAVEQSFLQINMTGMPPEQQKKYKVGLTQTLKNHKAYVQKALEGGNAIWATEWHVLPAWDDKQVLTPIGNLSQRGGQINSETFMINIRRMMGGMGIDMSLVGWADMLAGGLGDGAAFHTSAQIMRRSAMIRQSLTKAFNQVADLHWGLVYGETFRPQDRPWQFEFYSDQSAAATEMLGNRMTRMNTLALAAQAVGALKELGLNDAAKMIFLEDIAGLDIDQAQAIVSGMSGGEQSDGEQSDGANGEQPSDEQPDDAVEGDDDE